MRILIHGINFTPELTGAGKFTGEMAEWLAQRGHNVRVVTAPPYYPDWQIASGYVGWKYKREKLSVADEEALIWRCPLWVPKVQSGVKRLVHLASFACSSMPVALAQSFWHPQLVISVAPTLCSVPADLLLGRLSGAKTWLHVQDFEVDAAFSMGMLGLPGARRGFLAVEKSLFRQFDRLSTISERMLERLTDKGVSQSQCVLFPNWADIDLIRPLAKPSSFREELGLSDDQIVVLYAGNLGEKQGLDILIEAARKTQDDKRILWVIAGAGGARARLEMLSAGFQNLRWLPLQPLERLNDLLNLADIHVLPQRAEAADLVMPSKLTGMLASGRPIVASATSDTQIGQVVPGRGVLVSPGDADELARAVLELSSDSVRRHELGCNARAYAEEFLDRDRIMSRFERAAAELVSGVAVPSDEAR